MLLNLTEVVLKEGKVIEPQADLTTDVLSFPFGSYRIVKKAPSCMQHDDALIAGINLRNGLYRR